MWDPVLSCHIILCTVILNPWTWLCAVGVLASETLLCSRHSVNKTYLVPMSTPIPLNLALISSAPTSAPIPSISVLQPRFRLYIFILVHYLPLSRPFWTKSSCLDWIKTGTQDETQEDISLVKPQNGFKLPSVQWVVNSEYVTESQAC